MRRYRRCGTRDQLARIIVVVESYLKRNGGKCILICNAINYLEGFILPRGVLRIMNKLSVPLGIRQISRVNEILLFSFSFVSTSTDYMLISHIK